jgi:hypothetical protein
MTGKGEVVDSGANVVKSVAGFDLHRMLVGSRGELGVILEVALRIYPLRMMPDGASLPVMEDGCWIHRVPKSFNCDAGIRSECRQWIWADRLIPFPPHGWVMGPGGVRRGAVDPIAERFRRNLKDVLDPMGVLEEGWKS